MIANASGKFVCTSFTNDASEPSLQNDAVFSLVVDKVWFESNQQLELRLLV
jgi:hypothetical protein